MNVNAKEGDRLFTQIAVPIFRAKMLLISYISDLLSEKHGVRREDSNQTKNLFEELR